MMPPVASGGGSPSTTPRKRTCEPCRAGYGAMDVLWLITPIKPAFFERPGRNRFLNNCGEIRCARSLGEPYTNWGSNGSRPTVRKPKGGSRDCLKLSGSPGERDAFGGNRQHPGSKSFPGDALYS